MGRPGGFCQNTGPVGADVDRGRNLMCGILKTAELDQHLLGDAAFGPDRREYLCHGLFCPVACKGLPSRAVSGFDTGLESGAAISPESGPGDGAPSEIQSDAVAVVHEFLAVDDLSADGGFLSQRRDLYDFAGLPRAACNYASAVDADVVRVGHF